MITLTGVIISAFWGTVRTWIGAAGDGEVVAVAVRTAVAAEPERVTFHLLTDLQPAPAVEATEPADAA